MASQKKTDAAQPVEHRFEAPEAAAGQGRTAWAMLSP